MWEILLTLAVSSFSLVVSAPQNDGGLDSLIASLSGTNSSTQAPMVDAELNALISNVFTQPTNQPISTTAATILGTDNKPKQPQEDCTCVTYYLCRNGTISDDGETIIDIRSGFNDETSYVGWVLKISLKMASISTVIGRSNARLSSNIGLIVSTLRTYRHIYWVWINTQQSWFCMYDDSLSNKICGCHVCLLLVRVSVNSHWIECARRMRLSLDLSQIDFSLYVIKAISSTTLTSITVKILLMWLLKYEVRNLSSQKFLHLDLYSVIV